MVKNIDSNKAWDIIDDDITQFNERQYLNKYRNTNFIIENLDGEISSYTELTILDIGTGGGANLYHIAKAFQQHHFTGIGINKHYIEMAKKRHYDLGIKNTSFHIQDFSKDDLDNGFDIIGSSQVLNIIDCNKATKVLEQSFEKAIRGVFIFSLLTDSLLDYEINITDYYFDKVVPYNIYSIPKIESMAKIHGYFLKIKKWFEIDTDLPKTHLGRGTFTIRTDENKRIMFTDVLHLPWYFLYFERNKIDKNKHYD